MTIDKEKVIKGLECCQPLEDAEPYNCKECPYNEVSLYTEGCQKELHQDALDLLENAITVRPSWIVCRDCAHWDAKSGLTARRCDMHDIITKQSDWCSKAEKRIR